ncbi:hypothetical protein D3C85_1498750 [compost metagenome]
MPCALPGDRKHLKQNSAAGSILPNQLTEQVAVLTGTTIFHPLGTPWWLREEVLKHRDGAQQFIVLNLASCPATVPALQHFIGQAEKSDLRAGIHAERRHRLTRKRMHRHEIGGRQRVLFL